MATATYKWKQWKILSLLHTNCTVTVSSDCVLFQTCSKKIFCMSLHLQTLDGLFSKRPSCCTLVNTWKVQTLHNCQHMIWLIVVYSMDWWIDHDCPFLVLQLRVFIILVASGWIITERFCCHSNQSLITKSPILQQTVSQYFMTIM